MAGDLQSRGKGSAATVRRVGIVVGVLLMAGFATLLQQDRQARIDAAHRQSMALATGVDRLIHFAFRNLERALAGIAADAATWTVQAPEQREALLEASIAGVASRQPELHSIVLVDAQGNALAGGPGDPQMPQWLERSRSRAGLAIGPLQADGEGGMRLRVQARPERYALALETDSSDSAVCSLFITSLETPLFAFESEIQPMTIAGHRPTTRNARLSFVRSLILRMFISLNSTPHYGQNRRDSSQFGACPVNKPRSLAIGPVFGQYIACDKCE